MCPEPKAQAGPDTARKLGVAAVIIGLSGLLPPYTGPELGVPASVEVLDHVVPGLTVLVLASACLVASRRSAPPAMAMLVAGLGISLAGLWMTATHIPLLAQALRHEAPLGAAVYHSVPGLVVLALGLVWTASHWKAAA